MKTNKNRERGRGKERGPPDKLGFVFFVAYIFSIF
jgi:hypothetical protein